MRHSRKFLLSDGHKSAFVDAETMSRCCGFSKGTAYRVISGRRKLTDQERLVLCVSVLKVLPGAPPGWGVVDGCLVSPDGFTLTPEMLDQYAFVMGIMRSIERDYQRLLDENRALRNRFSRPSGSPVLRLVTGGV